MALPTDWQDTNQGDLATHTPDGGSAIEFSVISISGVGGVESSKGAEITGSGDFTGTGDSAVAKFAGDLKQTYTDVSMDIKVSKVQFAAIRPIVGRASRGAFLVTALSAETYGNASCDIISLTNNGSSAIDSEQLNATIVISPSGESPWA